MLIIGGGDGGVAREVCKHPAVKYVVQCEIDAVSLSSMLILCWTEMMLFVEVLSVCDVHSFICGV